jgi:hypothetical protein
MAAASALEDLYGLDMAEFTAARDALSKRLRASGDSQAADAVKRLRRPSQTVWGLNQVARANHELVAEALDAGQALRAATIKVLEGDRSALASAQTEERRAVDAIVAAVGARLESAGHRLTDAAAQRVAATVRAAFADTEVQAQLRAGTLTQEHDAPGFGLEPQAGLPVPRSKPAAPAKTKRRQQEEARASQLAEQARQLQQAAVEAERAAAQARKAADRAEAAWKLAQRKADEAASALQRD